LESGEGGMKGSTYTRARRGLVRAGWLAALAGGALLGLATLHEGASAEDKKPEAKTDLPSDLAHVPPHALLSLSIRLADVWKGDVGKSVRKGLGKEAGKVVEEFQGALGVAPSEVDRLTQVLQAPQDSGPIFAVRTVKPYDRKKLVARVAPGGETEKYKGKTLHLGKDKKATYLIDKHSFLTGPVDVLKVALEEPEGKGEGLRPALAAAAKKHTAVVGINPAVLARTFGDDIPGELDPFKPLLKATSAVFTADVGATTTADLRVAFAKAEDAKAGLKSLEAARKLARGSLDDAIKLMSKEKGAAEVVQLLKGFDASLKAATPKVVGSAVEASATM